MNRLLFLAHALLLLPLYAMSVQYRVFTGSEARPYLRSMAELTIKVLKDYPYLYEPDGGAQDEDVDCYYQSSNTIMVCAFDHDQLIATAIGLPLEQFEDKPCGFYPDRALGTMLPTLHGYFYVALLLVEKEYWHQGIARRMMAMLEDTVTATHAYTHMCTLVLECYQHDHPDAATYDGYYERCYQRYFEENKWHKHEPLVAYMYNTDPHMRLWSVPIHN